MNYSLYSLRSKSIALAYRRSGCHSGSFQCLTTNFFLKRCCSTTPPPGASPDRTVTSNVPPVLATSSNTTTTSTKPRFPMESDRLEYLRQANNTMEKYHETRILMKQGKLPSKNPMIDQARVSQQYQNGIQLIIVGSFIVAFLCTPYIGKRIAQDKEFRQKYIPSWYDFTIQEPDKPWTRQELHEQMLLVQKELRERAIAGEFTPDKLQELQRSMQEPLVGMARASSNTTLTSSSTSETSSTSIPTAYPHREGIDRSKVPKEWDKIHPGLPEGERLNEQ